MTQTPDHYIDQNGRAGQMSGSSHSRKPEADSVIQPGKPGREVCIYQARLGYELQEELDFLSNRSMEPNVFFTGRLLAPAMTRLDDRSVRFVVIRDENEKRSRMRFLMPFSVEKPGFSLGAPIIRAWSNPFGPLGTPLVDAEDSAGTLDDLLASLARKEAGLPSILVLPDLRLDGMFARMIKAIVIGRNLPFAVTATSSRPMLQSNEEPEAYLRHSISANHLREMKRQWRQLEKQGDLQYNVARQPDEVRVRMEEFLALEASGWKGRKRSALINDRYRSAFAREAVANLSEVDGVRIHTLDLDGRAIASMVVFMMGNEAWTWKTAYNEDLARFSPGKLLVGKLTEWHLDDFNIMRTDSCAVPDHPIMSRIWEEREEMGTLVIGLHQNSDRDVRQVATQLHLYRNTRNMARVLRQKIMSIAGLDG